MYSLKCAVARQVYIFTFALGQEIQGRYQAWLGKVV